MLWTLWRAILFEFWRMLLITTSVVVAAIAFATTVKPLADGSLSVDQAFRFLGYAIPPMLAYALPFAAGFSATMTYHRMVSENELTAAYASGISHKKILIPMLLSGVLLAGGLVGLNNQIIPRFLQRMEEMVTRDFAKILVNSLSQGQSAMIGNTEIHADQVEEVPPKPGSPIEQQFLLKGVAMVEAEDDGSIRIDGTAGRAWVQLLPAWALNEDDRSRIAGEDDRAVVMTFEDLAINESGDAVAWESVTSPAIPIPRVFKDDPKFMTASEMKTLKDDPDRMNFVDDKRIALAHQIASIRIYQDLKEQVRSGQAIEMISASNQRITILTGSMKRADGKWVLSPLETTGAIEVEIVDARGNTDRLRAQGAQIDPDATTTVDPFDTRASPNHLSMDLSLSNITILGPTETQIAETTYNSLNIMSDPLPDLLAMDSEGVLGEASIYRDPDSSTHNARVSKLSDRLEFEIAHLGREVISKVHERYAFSAACLIMVLAGGVTALKLKHAQPLVIYLWSFFPALLTILLISGGQQAIHKSGPVAIPLLWSGVLLISGYTLNALRKVSKH